MLSHTAEKRLALPLDFGGLLIKILLAICCTNEVPIWQKLFEVNVNQGRSKVAFKLGFITVAYRRAVVAPMICSRLLFLSTHHS
jgi:hypothetical protein